MHNEWWLIDGTADYHEVDDATDVRWCVTVDDYDGAECCCNAADDADYDVDVCDEN